ncbi:hypothetical protein J1605_019699 [Eschrichtius robustus]|uniref:Uncharacterized protein n=1 Tax=Eschrichtius robustus TaxID=9764 RepID=A0AB34HNQ4_ESCRO|nr:hypothetical protein J1605_019699 [Eschrichtius robustus]
MPGFAFLQLSPHLGAGVQAASGPKGRAPRGAELSGLGQEAKGQLGPQGSGPGRHQTQACVLHRYTSHLPMTWASPVPWAVCGDSPPRGLWGPVSSGLVVWAVRLTPRAQGLICCLALGAAGVLAEQPC